jgi:hypothetical protein
MEATKSVVLAVNGARIYDHRPTGMQSADLTLQVGNHFFASILMESVPKLSHTDQTRDGELHREDSTNSPGEDSTSGVASDFAIQSGCPRPEVARCSSRRKHPTEQASEYALSKRR